MARVRGEVHVKDARPLPSSLAISPQIFTCVQSLQENQTLSLAIGAPAATLIQDEAGPGCGATAVQRALLHLQCVPASICAG